MKRNIRTVLIAIVAICLVVQAAAEVSAGVSPGTMDRFSTIRDECPTFIWEMVAGAEFYELVVYQIPEEQLSVDSTIDLSEAQEVLYTRMPGGAVGWTPEIGRCLMPSAPYVWFVRAVFEEVDGVVLDAGEWSEALFFSVEAAPSVEEVEQALQVLQRYLGEESAGGVSIESHQVERVERSDGFRQRGSGALKSLERSVLSAPSAIRGTMPDPSGEFYGVVGVSSSPQGAGVAVANTAGGADLVLDGSVQGTANTELRESGINRPSSGPQTFDITNSGAGDMRLQVDGVEVVTIATDQDTLGGLSCATAEVAKWNGSSWLCADDENTGLSLPFEDSASTAGAAFKINNTSTSGNVFAVSGHNASNAGAGLFGWSTARIGFTSGVVGQSSSGVGTGVFGVVDHTSGANYGVAGISSSTEGTGVAGFASAGTGVVSGVYGTTASSLGHGVKGYNSATKGLTEGVYGLVDSTAGSGVVGRATAAWGTAIGVSGLSESTGGRGVLGYANAPTGETEGVRGVSDSTSGRGVYGHSTATTGGAHGVKGVSDSSDGRGVFGQATATSGEVVGVYGTTVSDEGYGVEGYASAGSGNTAGVKGVADSANGIGVWGHATAGTSLSIGLHGVSESVSGYGVTAIARADTGDTTGLLGKSYSIQGTGVRGYAVALTGTNYGVVGSTNSPDGYAGYFHGDVVVDGSLSKSGGSFKIDHPLDPANKYLQHSFVESPDMMNIYNGNVILDERGEAWVEMAEWFEVLNRDFRYQLTCIGGHAPVYIAEEIEGNLFKIGGGSPGMKVSWQLTGVRQDAWAEAHRIPVEEDKAGEEVGLYLHPEEHGQPRELGISWRRIQHVKFPDPKD